SGATRIRRPDGTFELEQVPAARRLVLFALGPNGAVGQADVHPPLKVGERRAGVEVPALERSELLFEVVDTSGMPIESVEYRIEERIGDSRAWTERRTADSVNGRYRVECLTRPSLRLRLSAEGTVERTVRVHAERENRFELRRARPIQVLVRDRAGFAVSGARVIARPAETEDGASRGGARRAWASKEGLAELELDPAHVWTLVARADGFGDPVARVSVAPEFPGGALVELVLPRTEPERPATIRGRIVRAGNGAPVWALSFTRLGGATASVDGPEFELVGVRPGPVRIEARCGGFETVRLPVEAVRPGETVDVGELRVRAASTVSVSVRDGAGRRVRGARVELRPLPPAKGGPARVPKRLVLGEKAEDRGTYSRGGIVRGKWRLRVSRRGHATVTRTLRLAQGQERVRVILNQR
ncbi:MAG: carboxypeptidase-like regulatory domain-containing protein, partial [Planctomycetota bacterium]